MRTYGLIGKTLTHSFSKKYFTEKFEKEHIPDSEYELFELKSIEEIQTLFNLNQSLSGLNVTIPYKEEVIPFLQKLDPSAQKVGAVNVIKFEKDGSKTGYNSDYFGFKSSLEKAFASFFPTRALQDQQVLILGTGGASKAVKAVCNDLDLDFTLVSRDRSKAFVTYDTLSPYLIQSHTIIVQTSPLGMYPSIDTFPPIPYEAIGKDHLLFDLVYNPECTAFMQKGLQQGAKAINGLEMLQLQAEKAWEIWNS
jgi:shikimate dehydrogenase